MNRPFALYLVGSEFNTSTAEHVMATEQKNNAEQLKNLEPKSDQVKGGREPTKHPAKVTVPDLKLG